MDPHAQWNFYPKYRDTSQPPIGKGMTMMWHGGNNVIVVGGITLVTLPFAIFFQLLLCMGWVSMTKHRFLLHPIQFITDTSTYQLVLSFMILLNRTSLVHYKSFWVVLSLIHILQFLPLLSTIQGVPYGSRRWLGLLICVFPILPANSAKFPLAQTG